MVSYAKFPLLARGFGWLLAVLLPLSLLSAMETAPRTQQRVAALSTNAWAFVASMSQARMDPAAAGAPDGRLYVTGGWGGPSVGYLASGERYDPVTDTWSPIADAPAARHWHQFVSPGNGLIYAIGGFDFSCYCNTNVLAYDPTTDSWSSRTSLTERRIGLSSAVGANGHIYAIGGAGSSSYNATAEEYDPTADSWTPIASMSVGRGYFGAATGTDGRVYVAGGIGNGEEFLSSAEVYDPGTNSWSAIAPLPGPLFNHELAAGADGLIYVIGGFDSWVGPLSTVLAYDPATNTWVSAPSLNRGRDGHASARGANGVLYAIGGRSNTAGIEPSVEALQTVSLNLPPTANAGADQTLECSAGGANVNLNGAASTDPESAIATYEWLESSSVIATGAAPSIQLAIGIHTITLRVTDAGGLSHEDDVVITIRDTSQPTVTLQQLVNQLWPPNHEMVKVVTGISASDTCDATPALTVTVTSNELINGRGDGNTDQDWKVIDNGPSGVEVWVRAERSGPGNARVYTITATATDAANNSTVKTVQVVVPRNQK